MLTHDYNKSYPSIQKTYSKNINVYQIVVVFCMIFYIPCLFTCIDRGKKNPTHIIFFHLISITLNASQENWFVSTD